MESLSRLRLTALLTAPAAFVAMFVLAGAVWNLVTMADTAPVDGGLARTGDALALIIVTESGAAATGFQVFLFGVVVPLVGLIGAAVVAWWLAGGVTRRLTESAAAVVSADREREANLAEVIHELRTPIAIMSTNLELASRGTEEAPRYLAAADKAAERMARTVDDLSTHGALAVDQVATSVDISEVAGSTASGHVAHGREKGVEVLVGGRSTIELEGVDPAAVGTVISNLVSNAIRLSPRGSSVVVDWGEIDDWVWVAVADDGPGLAHSQHALAFERGWQGSHDLHRSDRGSAGLGLTIARQLAEAQGGMITVASEEGAGATFALWLPTNHGAVRDNIVAADGIHALIQPWEPLVSTA